jgi:hypothetical protein
MLSLRDSGKIQKDNASILTLGALCGFKPSFSLKDFILKDCLVDTQPFRIGVALITWSPASPNLPQAPAPPNPKSWYENFLLNWGYENGVANFWYKQSSGKLKIEGQVLDWKSLEIDEATLFTSKNGDGKPMILREVAENIVKQRFPENFDAFIGVFNVPSDHTIDGGTTGDKIYSSFSVGDPFDFHTHEVGHLIGRKFNFDHSFGIETSGDCTGAYGHPYCVMSAETYGTNGLPRWDDSATFPIKEENFRGPGLSGATRSALGWANENQFDLKINEELSFTLRSLGSNQPGSQVIRIMDGDRVFCIEYRSSRDSNDKGISNQNYDATLKCDAVVVVSTLTGGIATRLAPNSATFLGHILLNFSVGVVPDTIVNFNPFWGIKVLSFDEKKSTVQIRVFRKNVFSLQIYRRTHHLTLSGDVDSWDVISQSDKLPLLKEDYKRVRAWRVNGNPISNLRSLI